MGNPKNSTVRRINSSSRKTNNNPTDAATGNGNRWKGRPALRSPVPYLGGKRRAVKHILPLIPEHTTYVETCFGGGSIFFAKKRSPNEVINDIDSRVANFFAVLRDEVMASGLLSRLRLTEYGREVYESIGERSCLPGSDPVRAAWEFYVKCRQSTAAIHTLDWRYDVSGTSKGMGMAQRVATWNREIERLTRCVSRLRSVQIENCDIFKILKNFDREATFFYIDPPYHPATRKSSRGRECGYVHEFDAKRHRELVDRLITLSGMAILSGYYHTDYKPLEDAGWQRQEFEISNGAGFPQKGKKTTARVECLWISPNALRNIRSGENDNNDAPNDGEGGES